MKKIVICLVACCFSFLVQAQDKQETIVLTNNKEGEAVLQLKWIKKTFYDAKPVDVYRKNVNSTEWEKINSAPIVKQKDMDTTVTSSADVTMLIEEIKGKKAGELDDFVLFLVVNEAMKSNAFAQLLGNFYEDKTAEAGETYVYKVQYTDSGKAVNISQPIEAGIGVPGAAPNDFRIYVDEENDRKVRAIWMPEEQRYFGVNIWRTDLSNKKRVKMNNAPVLAMIKKEKSDGTVIYPDFFFENQNHEYGKSYSYEAETVNFFGEIGKLSEPKVIEIINLLSPPIPAQLEITKKGIREAFFIWTDVDTSNLAGYNVLVSRSPEGPFSKANNQLIAASATSYIHTIDEFGSYFFKLEAVSKADIRAQSTVKNLDLLDVEPPPSPTNLQCIPDTGFVSLTWNPVDAGDLQGYHVFRSIRENSDVPFERVTTKPLEEPIFRDKLKKNAKNIFYYKVCAIDTSINQSELTEAVSVKLPDATPPSNPVLSAAKTNISDVYLEWLPVLAEDAVDIEIYRKKKTETDWQLIKNLAYTNTTFTDTEVQPNLDYQYRIRVNDDSGNWTDFSNVYNVRTKIDSTPAAGANKISTNYQKKKNQVTIKWKEDEPDRKGSVVFRKAEGSRLVALSPMIDDKAVFVDKKITKGKTYTYLVKTYYNDGKVGASSPEELSISE